jgi:outer membrane protein assembly factor BamB
MKNKFRCCLSIASLLAVTLFCVSADAQDDWPRFRGAGGSGVAASSVPTEWSPDKNIRWKTPLPGAGCSSPIVVGGKVFLTCYSGYGESRQEVGNKEDLARHVVCIDQESGKELWSKTIPVTVEEDDFSGIGVTAHGYASHTPVCDGEHLFVFLGKSGIYAYDLEGNELWNKKVGEGSDSKKWGSAASPVVCDDLVIVPALAESRAVYGLDKKTGEQRWVCESKSLDNTWSTPAVVDVDGDRQDIVIGVPDELWALNPKTGKLVWVASGVGGEQTGFYTSPMVSDGMIYASVGGRSGGGSVAVRTGGKKDVTESHVAWNDSKTSSSFASPVVRNGYMFAVGRGGIMQVVDVKTGEQVKKVRMESTDSSKPSNGGPGSRFGSPDYGSPIIAGDKLYYTKGNGETFVFTADADCEQVMANKLTDDAEIFSGTPAVSKGQLLIRSSKFLYCVAE